MDTKYQTDIIAWANEQAALLRAGNLSALDIEHIAEEIEDVGKSEQRELANRMSVLLAYLLKWQFHPTGAEQAGKEPSRNNAARLPRTSRKPPASKPHWTTKTGLKGFGRTLLQNP